MIKKASLFLSLANQICVLAVLSAFMLFPSLARCEEDNAQRIEKIANMDAILCTDDAISLVNARLNSELVSDLLEGIRQNVHFDAKWTTGNKNYDQVRAIVAAAYTEDIKANGPFHFFPSERDIIRGTLSTFNPPDLLAVENFFNSPVGKLYWKFAIDGVMCKEYLKTANGPKFPPLQDELLHSWQKINMENDAKLKGFEVTMNGLSNKDQSAFLSFDSLYSKLAKKFTEKQIGINNQYNLDRIHHFMDPHRQEIADIARNYRPD